MIRRALAGVLLAVMMLPACTGAKESADPTEEKSPAPTAPAMPEIAQDESAAGAEAFVRHYIDVLNYAAVTGETEELKQLSSPDCSGCEKYIDLYESTYADGGYFTGGEWSVEDLQVQFDEASEEQIATVEVAIAAGTQKSNPKEQETDTPTNKVTVSFAMHSESHTISQFGLGEPG